MNNRKLNSEQKGVFSMMDLALLGCGGSMPMTYRRLSAMLINFRGRKVLIDCGEGTQVAIRSIGWGFKTIDYICISHFHGDHTVGIPGLLGTIGNSGRTEPLTIIGPKGMQAVIDGLRVICPYLPYEVRIIEAPNESVELYEDMKLETLELEHSAPCLGYRFDVKRRAKFSVESAENNNVPKILWNRLQKGSELEYKGRIYKSSMVLGEEREGIRLSFITDSRPLDVIPKFIENSDLFVCEGTYGNDEDKLKAIANCHMTFREAATMAREGNVKEMLLTHFSPAMMFPEQYIMNAREVFENTVLGEDGLIKNLSFK